MTLLLIGLLGFSSISQASEPGDRKDDPMAEFIGMLDEELTKDLGTDATEDLIDIVNVPATTTMTNERKGGGATGSEQNPLMDDCLAEAIEVRTAAVGVAQAKADIAKWKAKLAAKDLTEYEFWAEVVQCKDYCARILVDSMNCYTKASASKVKGIILFDTGVRSYQPRTQGTRGSGYRPHDNDRVLNTVITMLRGRPDYHVMLEGRASRIGSDATNFTLSAHRSDAVKSALIERGIDASRIHWRWIGEGEPYFRQSLASVYKVTDYLRDYGEQGLNQSVTIYLYAPKNN